MRAFTYITGIGDHETVLNVCVSPLDDTDNLELFEQFTEATKTADTDRGVGVYRYSISKGFLSFRPFN